VRPTTLSFLLVAALGVLVACHGNQTFTPLAPGEQPPGPASSQERALIPPGIRPRASGVCSAPEYKPNAGPFVVFFANGNVKKGTFKSSTSPLTLWFAFRVKKSKPTPIPSSSPTTGPSTIPSPTPIPTNRPAYIYEGEYTLAKAKQTGCAFVFTTQSGKPFTGSKYNALAFGDPLIKYPPHYKTKVVAHGAVSIKIAKLSANGGKGTATLLLGNGNTFDTAKVTLTYRSP